MTSKIVVNNIEADAGVSTVTFNSNVVRGDSNLHSTGLALGAGSTVGAVTGVTTYYGDGSQLTGITQTTINNNADNRVITGSGTANTLEGESTLTYNGTNLTISNGNLVIGTTGKGIDFSATADGFGTTNEYEVLDDYEEGDFTPYLGGVTNYSSYNVTGQGHYVKIGKAVHINISFGNIDLNNSAAGRVMIYNLPFAPFIVSGTDCRGVSSNYMSHKVAHANDGMIHSWYIETTYGSFQGQITKNNANWTSWDASNFVATGVYLDFSGTYFTAS
jgi:hypothetical protein